MKRTAIVICPGRGTYNAAEMGYLSRHFPDADLLASFDAVRENAGQEALASLDTAAKYTIARHGRGDNASALIFAAGYGDFLSIDRSVIEIVAVTGNSMGWYTALACAGAVEASEGFDIANTMGTLMQEALIGGQLVYPWIADDWAPNGDKYDELMQAVRKIDERDECELALSINLGAMLVLAGNKQGLEAFENAVPKVQDRFPLRLANHAAFHTHLQQPVADRGQQMLANTVFSQPDLPMIDGRGAIWWPHAANLDALRDYTLGAQVTQTFDFTRAVTIAAREFAPDLFIVTGPGTTLGGAVAQSLILADWRAMKDKSDFKRIQNEQALLVSMGMEDQRGLATKR